MTDIETARAHMAKVCDAAMAARSAAKYRMGESDNTYEMAAVLAAIKAERERCIRLMTRAKVYADDDLKSIMLRIADAIRKEPTS